MGSEHYCLRWNNHQSNLLGVFSQLLQDESLVDVTLSCSEGAPIRAHKVVLSACSSYFQSLFLDHPEKHPIVILKDVRFAELQTLVEFMYKGEVNVQYCQLSALLKTAESLKVKGLAEMTNQNTTLREPEREPERLRPHSQPCKSSSSCDSPVDATLSGASTSTSNIVASSSAASASAASAAPSIATAATTPTTSATTTNATSTTSAAVATSLSSKRSTSHDQQSTTTAAAAAATERCSPSPPKRIHVKSAASIQEPQHRGSPQPLDLYQRRLEQQLEDSKENSLANNNNATSASGFTATTVSTTTSNEKTRSTTPQSSASGTMSTRHQTHEGDDPTLKHERDSDRETAGLESPERLSDVQRGLGRGDLEDTGVEKIEDIEDVDYGDEEMDLDDDGDNSSEDIGGLNMKIGSSSLAAALVSPNLRAGLESGLCSLGGSRERDRDHGDGGGGGGGGGVDSARSTPLTGSAALALDSHSQRPASRSSRDGSGLDRPSSRGGLSGLPSTSGTSLAGGLSPSSSTAAALGLVSDTLAGPSGLGPVQSVPLSLKKEIDCSEDDNSNSRHLQPRSASASGILGGEIDYRTSHESVSVSFVSITLVITFLFFLRILHICCNFFSPSQYLY
uniref:Uncharacterized protein n=1 Tax=Musca domestica TaxID=7370 RepID=A0A1I8N478_MUSDO